MSDFFPTPTKKLKEMCKEQFEKSRGLYRKYDVRRTDGSSEPGGKHEDCEYFVLDLTHDKYAKNALVAYAQACQIENPNLALDLTKKALRCP